MYLISAFLQDGEGLQRGKQPEPDPAAAAGAGPGPDGLHKPQCQERSPNGTLFCCRWTRESKLIYLCSVVKTWAFLVTKGCFNFAIA